MRNQSLVAAHLRRATARLKAVDALHDAKSWADVVRESQEVVELALRGLLRSVDVDPPRIHDLSDVLEAEQGRLPERVRVHMADLTGASRSLRRDRELAYYGAEDLNPSEFYRKVDADRARAAARAVVTTVSVILE